MVACDMRFCLGQQKQRTVKSHCEISVIYEKVKFTLTDRITNEINTAGPRFEIRDLKIRGREG